MSRGGTVNIRLASSLLATLLLVASAGAAGADTGPPRRADVIPGLEPLDHLVDTSAPWLARATAGLEQALPSFLVIQRRDTGMPPLSGFIIGPNHVVTAHLRELSANEQPPTFRVRAHDGQFRDAVQVAGWREWDFGVLELDAPLDLPPIRLGDERQLSVGDLVINIGNPTVSGRSGLGLATVAQFLGIVDGFIATDISTATGGSGGPVLDIDGALIGMASLGLGGFGDLTDIHLLEVSELRLRNSIPIDRRAGTGGVAASTIAALTEPYR